MTRLLITTTCRKSKLDDPSGHLYVFDLNRWEIAHRGSIIEPPYRDVDPNPRGGFRGGKGIAIVDNQIILANSVGVFLFNQNWDLLKVISHPSCSGIHDIFLDRDNNLWVTSARNDLLFKFDLDGNLLKFFYFRQEQPAISGIPWTHPTLFSNEEIENGQIDFRDPRTHKVTTHDTVHVNSICQQPDGSMLISLGLVVGEKFSTLMKIKDFFTQLGLWSWIVRVNQYARDIFSIEKDRHSDLILQPAKGLSIIMRIHPRGDMLPCLMIDNVFVPSHSVLGRADGTAVYLNTTNGEILHFKPENGQIISKTNVSNQFLRGIAQLSVDDLVVGSQNTLLLFSLKTLEIRKQVNLSNDLNEAVFAIHEFPEKFLLPPISFESRLGKLVGFNDKEAIFEKDYNHKALEKKG